MFVKNSNARNLVGITLGFFDFCAVWIWWGFILLTESRVALYPFSQVRTECSTARVLAVHGAPSSVEVPLELLHALRPRRPLVHLTVPAWRHANVYMYADGKYVTCQDLKWCCLGNSWNFLIDFCIFRSEFSLFSVMKRDAPFRKYITSMLMVIYHKAMILATM